MNTYAADLKSGIQSLTSLNNQAKDTRVKEISTLVLMSRVYSILQSLSAFFHTGSYLFNSDKQLTSS